MYLAGMRRQWISVCLAMLLWSGSVYGEPLSDTRLPMLVTTADALDQVVQGRALMGAFRLREAEGIFRQLIKQGTGRETGYYHLTLIGFYRALFVQDAASYRAYFALADSLDQVLNQASPSVWRTHFLAENALHQGFVQARRGKTLKAALAGRRAYKRYAENLQQYPEFPESHKGMGVLRIMIGSVPDGYQWVLNMLGYSGTVQQGMDHLQYVIDRSTLAQAEAELILGLADVVLNQSKRNGPALIKAAYMQHPESPVPALLYAYALLAHRDGDEAASVLERAARASKAAYFQTPFLDYYLGDLRFTQNRFKEAEPHFTRFIQGFQGTSLKSDAWLKGGLVHELTGDRRTALTYYRQVQAATDFDNDVYAQNQAEHLLKHPLTDLEHAMLRGVNAFDGGRFAEAISIFQAVRQDDKVPPVQRARAAYFLGRTFQAKANPVQALVQYQYAVDHPGSPDTRWAPWAQFYIGEIHESAGRWDAAQSAYQAALAYNGKFDYRRALQQRVRAALGRLPE